ncbi:MAG: lipopolysaccharide biosynthesis protein [Planctomycetia bacterium]
MQPTQAYGSIAIEQARGSLMCTSVVEAESPVAGIRRVAVIKWRLLRDRVGGTFLGDVLKLSFGTLAGRLITLAAMPLLTRLYSPDDFALLAVYLALVSTLAVVACLRLEIAITLAETDESAVALLALSLIALVGVTVAIAAAVVLMPGHIAAGLGCPGIAPWLWLVPLGVWLAGSYSALQFWSTRARRFGDIARTRVGQAVSGVATILALGWAGVTPLGLLLGNVLNIGSGGLSLAAGTWRHDAARLRGLRSRHLWPVLWQNYRFPLISMPEALLNVAGAQVPVLLIAAHAGAEAGFLLLAMQVMTAPMTLLGSSISQVYVSRAPQEFRDGQLAPFTLAIMRRLALVGTGPLVLAGALAPPIFPVMFGSAWERSGQLIGWLVPWMVLQFVASPVSMVMFVVGRQRAMLMLTMLGVVLRVGFVWIAVSLADVGAVIALAVGSILYYLAVLAYVLNAAGIRPRQAVALPAAFLDWRVLAPVALAAVFHLLT